MMKVRNEIVQMQKKIKMVMQTHENDIVKKNLKTESSGRLNLKSAFRGMHGRTPMLSHIYQINTERY